VIREAGLADVARIVALIGDVAAENRWVRAEVPFDAAARERTMTQRMSGGELIAFVAEAGDALAGQLSLRVRDGRAAFGMVVAAAHRRRGIGRQLVAAAIVKARERAVSAIEIEVYAHNRAALALYRSLGFVRYGEPAPEARRSGERWTIVRMRHELG
jgi:putative acetyltransferase